MSSLKIAQLVGVILLILGVIIRAGMGEFFGMHIALLGILIYAVARIAAWLKADKP